MTYSSIGRVTRVRDGPHNDRFPTRTKVQDKLTMSSANLSLIIGGLSLELKRLEYERPPRRKFTNW
jgi:hypothetical protein